MPLKKPMAYEQGDLLYLVAPVTPYDPTEAEIEEFAFGKSVVSQMRDGAPNPLIQWFSGHYVEGDRPNLNGAMWLSEDLAIAQLTPVMMPVTVMHDPRTAVGVIANAALKTPDKDNVPRAKIDTALATWKHRFPEAVDEALHNYKQGTLMQSMECLAPSYDCSVCGMHFVKLPKKAEEANWCDHLKASQPGAGYEASRGGAENANASRILRGVTFTGTGLIYGSRGATGADPEANLEAFQEEVAEFHAKSHRDKTYRPTSNSNTKPRSKRKMEIEDREYQQLVADKAKAESDLAAEKQRADDAERERDEAKSAAETAEAAKATVEKERDDAISEKTKLEEQASAQSLRDQRWEALGSAFKEKIDGMPTTKANLLKQAESLKDNEWAARLEELSETTGVKSDAQKDGEPNEDENAAREGLFEREEVARFGGGNSKDNKSTKEPTKTERASVMSGLVHPPKAKA